MVVIINGFPRSGKSQFVEYCKEVSYKGWVQETSTVDFVKEIAAECGWNGVKDAKNRKFLSDLKDLLTQWDNVPFKKSCHKIDLMHAEADYVGTAPNKMVMFVHCREPEEIQKFVDFYGEDMCHTLLIRRPAVENDEQSNHADSQVLNYIYDNVIINDGSLDDLRNSAIAYLKQIVGDEIINDYRNHTNLQQK